MSISVCLSACPCVRCYILHAPLLLDYFTSPFSIPRFLRNPHIPCHSADSADDTDAAAADEDIAMAMSQPGTSHTLFSRDCMPAWVSVT
jgi:hypothetical protein